MKIKFCGAARMVTGSCYHLTINGRQILVDCGMKQGKNSREANLAPFLFDPAQIETLFLTHAHIDHSGLIPRLVDKGLSGNIITTAATADLATIMLLDSAHIQESDANWLTKKSFRTGEDITYEPLYKVEDAQAAARLFDRKSYGKTERLGSDIRYCFADAGHILGSGSLELWYKDSPAEKKLVFSGDIGKKESPIIRDPETIETSDYVVIESTYGDRNHKDLDTSVSELADAVKDTFRRGGNVVIPSFAVGRTQDILYFLNNLVREGRLKPADVYVDSPLAEAATQVYLDHPEVYDEDARRALGEKQKRGMRVRFTTSVKESQKINTRRSGIIIIAGSGMCEGGRVQHHLKHNLWRPESSVVFVGFQAEGTLGREIVQGAKKVSVLGEPIAVRARIYTINGFSAHADRRELLGWLGAFTNNPEVFVVHGEEAVALGFAEAIRTERGLVAHVPEPGQEFDI
jgi:metallo-beta-lactamase family protein